MTDANGLRLLMAARKSRKGDGEPYERQDFRAQRWAESEGHAVIHATADTVSSQTPPWKRKNLGPWMTDPALVAMYDGILVSDTDRISRGTQEDFVYIEHWASVNGKLIIVAKGPQYPARNDSERGDWDGQKRRARNYWEDVKSKHADTREVIQANGGIIGLPPFGYVTSGQKLRKTFVIDPVTGPLAKEAFKRIAQGKTASSVALWLTAETGKLWRVKRVTDMIKRRTYLGERDGVRFEAIVTEDEWDAANNGLSGRAFTHGDLGGRKGVHGYSGRVYCECGASMYRHKSERGSEKYRCARGRRGDLTEERCTFGAPLFAPVNDAIDTLIARITIPERVMVAMGGDHGRKTELQRLQGAMKEATASMDMAEVMRLATEVSELQAKPAEPIRTTRTETGKTYAEIWNSGSLNERRALLNRGEYRLSVRQDEDGWRVYLNVAEDAKGFRMFSARDWKISMSEAVA